MAEPSLLDESAAVTARRLLGCELRRGGVAVEITEVEAYEGEADPASHAWKGPNRKNAVMFGPAGRLYTYSMHGHTCCNVVCSPEGVARAVLVRAGRVVAGLEEARSRRPGVGDVRLARGPGCLTRALGITMEDSAAELLSPDSAVQLWAPESADPAGLSEGPHGDEAGGRAVVVGPRVGVPRAEEEPLRFAFAGDPTVSAFRRAARPAAKASGGAAGKPAGGPAGRGARA